MDHSDPSLTEAARAALRSSDFLSLERVAHKLIAIGERGDSLPDLTTGYYYLGIAFNNLNRPSEARVAMQTTIELAERAGDRFAVARTMLNLATVEMDHEGNVSEARRLYELAAPVMRELGRPINVAIALGNLGEICRLEGDNRSALRNSDEALRIFAELGGADNIVWQRTNIAHYRFLLREYDAAIAEMRATYPLLRESLNPRWIAWYFEIWYLIAAGLDQLEVASQLLAFVDKTRDERNQPRSQVLLPWLSRAKERVARELPPARHDELIAAGEALTIDSAQALTDSISPPA